MAAGLTVESGRIDALRTFLEERLAPEWEAAHEARTLRLDAVAHPAAVDFAFGDALKAAAPFGMGNPEPRFAFSSLRVRVREGGRHRPFALHAGGQGRGAALGNRLPGSGLSAGRSAYRVEGPALACGGQGEGRRTTGSGARLNCIWKTLLRLTERKSAA